MPSVYEDISENASTAGSRFSYNLCRMCSKNWVLTFLREIPDESGQILVRCRVCKKAADSLGTKQSTDTETLSTSTVVNIHNRSEVYHGEEEEICHSLRIIDPSMSFLSPKQKICHTDALPIDIEINSMLVAPIKHNHTSLNNFRPSSIMKDMLSNDISSSLIIGPSSVLPVSNILDDDDVRGHTKLPSTTEYLESYRNDLRDGMKYITLHEGNGSTSKLVSDNSNFDSCYVDHSNRCETIRVQPEIDVHNDNYNKYKSGNVQSTIAVHSGPSGQQLNLGSMSRKPKSDYLKLKDWVEISKKFGLKDFVRKDDFLRGAILDLILHQVDASECTSKTCSHQCHFCLKIFRDKRVLAKHQRQHTDRHPYVEKMRVRSKTVVLAKSDSDGDHIDSEWRANHLCHQCYEEFDTDSKLRLHIQRYHNPIQKTHFDNVTEQRNLLTSSVDKTCAVDVICLQTSADFTGDCDDALQVCAVDSNTINLLYHDVNETSKIDPVLPNLVNNRPNIKLENQLLKTELLSPRTENLNDPSSSMQVNNINILDFCYFDNSNECNSDYICIQPQMDMQNNDCNKGESNSVQPVIDVQGRLSVHVEQLSIANRSSSISSNSDYMKLENCVEFSSDIVPENSSSMVDSGRSSVVCDKSESDKSIFDEMILQIRERSNSIVPVESNVPLLISSHFESTHNVDHNEIYLSSTVNTASDKSYESSLNAVSTVFTDDYLLGVSVSDLNRKISELAVTEKDERSLKERRRRLKHCIYQRNCRRNRIRSRVTVDDKLQRELVVVKLERDALKLEVLRLKQNVTELEKKFWCNSGSGLV